MNRLQTVTKDAPTRRDVLVVGATLSAGALLVSCSPATLLSTGSNVTAGVFGPFIKIAVDGAVTVVNKHIEFGQGSHAGLAAIVAEEMGADWSRVVIEQAPANARLFANVGMGVQGTGGSSAISNSWDQLRTAGAAARAMFAQAAATRWSVPVGEVRIADSVASHTAGHSATFAELLTEAAAAPPPQSPTLRDPSSFTLIGTDRVRRKDSRAKSTGQARFTADVRMPNMLTAMVAHAPRFGGKVASFNADAARRVPGVVDVVQIPTGVAVLADNTHAARTARDALQVQWDNADAEARGSAQIMETYRQIAAGQGPADVRWQAFETRGDAATHSGETLDVTYDFPFLAHATMEPMNCVAQVGSGAPKLTFGSQIPTLDQLNTARIVGVLPGSVEIEQLFAGGSFGRRGNFQSDYAAECVHIAKHVGGGRPVKLIWTREDDMSAGYFRPMVHHALKVGLGTDGLPAYWRHRVVTQSIMKGSPMGGGGLDETAVEGAKGSPYLVGVPIVDAQVALHDSKIPILWWRSVGATHTAFVMEHTIDQLAKRANRDPIEYRRALYQRANAARHLAALNLAVERAGPAAAAGYTRGVAVHESFGSVVAQIAEVKMEGPEPRVGRVITAIDCGVAIAPDQIAAQMEGGTCYGLSAGLFGEVTVNAGEVQQKNFDAYRVLRINEAPQVETHIVPSTRRPSGVGEPGTPVIAPAVANALFAMTGAATSRLPLVRAT